MEKLSRFKDTVTMQKIGEKLGRLSLGKLTYQEAMSEVNEIEQLYVQRYGAQSNWDSALKHSVAGIRQDAEDFYSRKNQCLENNSDLLSKEFGL